MVEQGVVTAVKGNRATVKVDKKDECSKCGMCLFPKGASSIDFDAQNPLEAKEGDKVIIQTEKEGKLLSAVLVFLVPLLLIGITMLVGYLLKIGELYIVCSAIGLVALWFLVLALIDKRLKKSINFSPKIIKIIHESED